MTVIIPAYKPDERLMALVRALDMNRLNVVVVDGASGPHYRPCFDAAAVCKAACRRTRGTSGKSFPTSLLLKRLLRKTLIQAPACRLRWKRGRGMSLQDLAALFEALGCKLAYNLDGGNSAMLSFNQTLQNQPSGGGRELSDILYIGEL